MIKREREENIINYLKRNTFASIHDIVEITESSEATIRRDLSDIEKKGRIHRIRGGAELSKKEKDKYEENKFIELPFQYRKEILHTIKKKIAQTAVSFIEEEDTIIIDGGSTTYHMVEFLKNSKLTIITNSFAVANFLVSYGKSKIILPEGVIYPESSLILNPLNQNPFSNYHAKKVFIGVGGINKNIITNTEINLIQTQRSMIDHAEEVIILTDSSKFGKAESLFLCNIERVSKIITDSSIDSEYLEAIQEKGVQVIIV